MAEGEIGGEPIRWAGEARQRAPAPGIEAEDLPCATRLLRLSAEK